MSVLLNCSSVTRHAASDSSGASTVVHDDLGCSPEAGAVACGMNLSWILANASAQDLDDVCLSEAAYLEKYLGPPRSPVFLPVFLVFLAIFAVGALGNALTCAVILRYKVMRTPTNYYLLSLAVSDLVVLLLAMPMELYELWRNYPFLLGAGGCLFKTFLLETVCFASVLNVTALSAERYVAVLHPLRVKHTTTRSHAKRVILALWAVSMLCAVPITSLHGVVVLAPRFGREFPRSAMCTLVSPSWMYHLISLVSTLLFFLLPMLLISVLYLLIGLRLHRERDVITAGRSRGGGLSCAHSLQQRTRNRQVTKMLCVLVVVFGLCWAPFHVDRLLYSLVVVDPWTLRHPQLFECVHIASGVCFYLSSAVNPILYTLMSTRFREMFRQLTCFRLPAAAAASQSSGAALRGALCERTTPWNRTPS